MYISQFIWLQTFKENIYWIYLETTKFQNQFLMICSKHFGGL